MGHEPSAGLRQSIKFEYLKATELRNEKDSRRGAGSSAEEAKMHGKQDQTPSSWLQPHPE